MSDDRKRTELPVVSGAVDVNSPASGGMDRRHALKIMAIAAASPALASCEPGDATDGAATAPTPASNANATGTAWDPDLVNPTVPWERSLTEGELASLVALCDVIIPADDRSPSASQIGAPDFIDEWVSAPYDGNRNDKVVVRGGLLWLDLESARRFGEGLRFQALTQQQQHDICDDICYGPNAATGFEAASRFFDKVRDLTATAFWTTDEGMRDLQYIGNTPLASWGPPPPEVLRHLGLE